MALVYVEATVTAPYGQSVKPGNEEQTHGDDHGLDPEYHHCRQPLPLCSQLR